jgi:hypothetical protein
LCCRLFGVVCFSVVEFFSMARNCRRWWAQSGPFLFFFKAVVLLSAFLLSVSSEANIKRAYELPSDIPACSRSKSRDARGILTSHILPIVEQSGVAFSSRCALDPARDMYETQEREGKDRARGYWQCLYSGKHFKNEDYLDLHLSRSWDSKIPSNATICLADFCDILSCPVSNEERHHVGCRRKDIDLRHIKCLSIFQSCFRGEETSALFQAHSYFTNLFCSRDICDFELPPIGVKESSWYHSWVAILFLSIGFISVASIILCLLYERHAMKLDSDIRRFRKHRAGKRD